MLDFDSLSRKIKALEARAASTPFEAERQACVKKANELRRARKWFFAPDQARSIIDELMGWARRG